ncbi:hypothetical protein [Deinococcus soli (ex Cha et al. 2016)]|uniref:Uncharacterized protein n=2 Tax=Deinococcus soli (ex Cha et al. 2016) TaxID=1309411 RepID=A0ACC6KGK4_9DEIO|nr:hypothetical protein [Deinococcus soli (ex Cha et al. 2016)]MDR6219018.1 hypothetical protein [Deinococcus soli (ex Cha et al. 2016)]MDR6328815.1 hypothetical protein [Deinococcus soli (ex Cha et al. 2016)]MDR6751698.1 hypothetical protein [Deinococcus soli (ex Cha et al. 2016)]
MTVLIGLLALTVLATLVCVWLAWASYRRGRAQWAAVKAGLALAGGAVLTLKLLSASSEFSTQLRALHAYLAAPRPAGLPPAPTWVDVLSESLARVGGWPFELALGALLLALVVHALEVRRDA